MSIKTFYFINYYTFLKNIDFSLVKNLANSEFLFCSPLLLDSY